MDDAIRRYKARRQHRLDAKKWEESKHPRDEKGQFTGEGSAKGGSAKKPKKEDVDVAKRNGFSIDGKIREARKDANSRIINPNYGKGKDYSLNCGNCAVAYELKRRGIDVEAAPKQWMKTSEFHPLFYGFKWEGVKAKRKAAARTEIESKIKQCGEGARGIIFSEWDGRSSGHYINFEVVNGKVEFFDCQSGDNASDYFADMKPSKLIFARTDNLKIRDGIFKCVRRKKRVSNKNNRST